MATRKNKGLINRLSNFISSYYGQIFFNFAYSIGAAIVIWGVLFKLLHLPGGNALLAVGLGTEIVMFILTAFDLPNEIHESNRVINDEIPTTSYHPSTIDPELVKRADKATREYCKQAEALAENMRRLNEIYSNMLSALENPLQHKEK
ncbi:MAG: hypothetical protein K2K88_04595 [Muribaculaceae bacterium]|nr:hypothetical protein [Muribaculaceae bacterium]MDE6352404.1 hypothetical protein [Muribaculaceae bacterium]